MLSGFLIGAMEGTAGGFTEGAARGLMMTGGPEGAWSEGWRGGLMGFGVGGALGAIFHQVCFVAGTQVVVGQEEGQGDSEAPLTAEAEGGLATARRVRYVTRSIEELAEGGQVLARDQHDPAGALVPCRIGRTYIRRAYHLRVLTVRDADGREQTIRVTDEHPFYVAGRGWTKARELSAGELLLGAAGEASAVISNLGEAHPQGVTVYNLEVEEAHSYFVRAQGSDAEPVWVHNAEYEMVPDAMAPRYKKGWAGDVVGDHRLSRAIAKVLGVDADVAANIVQKGYATNARKGGIEGNWLKSYKSYVDGGLSPEQALEVLHPELKALVRDAWPLLRPNSQLDRIPVYPKEPAV